MKAGLNLFSSKSTCISNTLFNSILGNESAPAAPNITNLPKNVSVKGLPVLNQFQQEAVRSALRKPLILIQGPPGTGKTVTSASIVYHLVRMFKAKPRQKIKILVCAPSNIVVDHLAEKINQTGVRVVRVCSKSRETVSTSIEPLTLHNQVKSLELPELKDLKKLDALLKETQELKKKDEENYKKMYSYGEEQILKAAEVICCTCTTSFDPRLKKYTFRHVLIDEATQAVEPECLLPMLSGCKKAILVGDHMQLGPVVISRQASLAGLKQSLFERLIKIGVKPEILQVQYRMHPDLSAFSSNNFYNGQLLNGVSESSRIFKTKPKSKFVWPNPKKQTFFWHVKGVEEPSATGTSFLNRSEVVLIDKILTPMISDGVSPDDIGIITPYKGQRGYLTQYLLKSGTLEPSVYKRIEIASIDSFQGREKEVILISTVRSSEKMGIGFLADSKRLNVALTRAKKAMIVVGNAVVLCKNKFWNSLLYQYSKEETVFEGNDLNSLMPMIYQFQNPKEFKVENRNDFYSDLENLGEVGIIDDGASELLSETFNSNLDGGILSGYEPGSSVFQLFRKSTLGQDMVLKREFLKEDGDKIPGDKFGGLTELTEKENDGLLDELSVDQEESDEEEKFKAADRRGVISNLLECYFVDN